MCCAGNETGQTNTFLKMVKLYHLLKNSCLVFVGAIWCPGLFYMSCRATRVCRCVSEASVAGLHIIEAV